LFNYPNPFSTSTRFVFTLTGSKVPDYFRIQILTVTGKIVREIDKSELGPLHIGRNITQYAWDGKDSFGDQLANGVYLYRVLTQLDGKPLKHRETTADSFFVKEYGKMFLIR
jgi:flagellar hook assembly protein FlgD